MHAKCDRNVDVTVFLDGVWNGYFDLMTVRFGIAGEDVPAMPLHRTLGNCQAPSAAAADPLARLIGMVKRFENSFVVGWADAWAVTQRRRARKD